MSYEDLYYTVVQGHTEEFYAMVDEVELDQSEDLAKHLLSAAVRGGDEQVVRELLDRGVDPNGGVTRGTTPLHTAIREGKTDVVRVLVEGGAGITVEDQHGKRPLHRAVFEEDYETTKLLIEHGADPTHEDEYGHSPLWLLRTYRDHAGAESAEPLEQYFDLMTDEQLAHEASCEPEPTGLDAGHTCVDLSGDVPEWVWEHLVPPSGQADTVQGELLRAVENLRDEGCRNGYANWWERHDRLVDFLEAHLCDEDLFEPETVAQIRADLDRVREQYVPRVGDEPNLFDRLTDRVVEYCEKRPELIENLHDEDLGI